MKHLAYLVLAACGSAPARPVSPPPAAAPDAPISNAAPPVAPRCDADQRLPAVSFAPTGLVCDVADRAIVIEDKAVVVYARPAMKPVRGKISNHEHLGNRCDGPGGGHAGCSITYDRYASPVLGSAIVELGTNIGDVLVDEKAGDQDCRDLRGHRRIVSCATAKRTAVVTLEEDDRSCKTLHGSLWEGAGAAKESDGAASGGDTWTFRSSDFTIVVDGRAKTAELVVGGEHEACAIASVLH